jgi:4-amino-4-deoxy-L-arabinose transferase-like glycosyltransferase
MTQLQRASHTESGAAWYRAVLGPAWVVAAAAAVATGLGLWFALAVPLGLPYDEPAHWGTVIAYASEHRMPVLGEPGVPYEAQMGPMYYTLAALLLNALGGVDQAHAATLLRLAGVVLLPLLVLLTYRIGRQLSASPAVSAGASTVLAVTPLLLMVGGSIQNDVLCFVLIAVALMAGMRLLSRPDGRWPWHLGLGVLIGLAILTKVVALALVPALVFGYLVHGAPWSRRMGWMVASGIGVLATSGWWFVRNLVLYGDLTASSAMARLGITFARQQWSTVGDAVAWLGNVVSYIYIPVEYYRNVLRSATPLRLTALVLASVTVVVLIWQAVRQRSQARSWLTGEPGRAYAIGTLFFAVVGCVIFSFTIFNGAPRLAFHAAPVAAVVFMAATWRRPFGWLAAATVVAFVVADIWLVTQAAQVSDLPVLFG